MVNFGKEQLLGIEVTEKVLENNEGLKAAVTNVGTIDAAGGAVLLTSSVSKSLFDHAVNNEGVIKAKSAEYSNGRIRLFGSGSSVLNTGTLDASSTNVAGGSIKITSDSGVLLTQDSQVLATGETGGSVEISGESVLIDDQSLVSVSGRLGGGEIAVRAETTAQITDNASLRADATIEGDGGAISIAAESIEFSGEASARGGELAGDGGHVELAATESLSFSGTVDTSAPNGEIGTLALSAPQIDIADDVGVTAAALESSSANVEINATQNVTLHDLSQNEIDLGEGSLSINVEGVALSAAESDAVGFLMAGTDDTIRTSGTVTVEVTDGSTNANALIDVAGRIETTSLPAPLPNEPQNPGNDIALVANQGRVRVRSTGELDASANDGADAGRVLVSAVGFDGENESGTVHFSGSVDVSNDDGVGGEVRLLGDRVGLFDEATIDASGSLGGGTVLVGGNFQGKGPEQNSLQTLVSVDSTINADATDQGDGGTVIIWANVSTRFYGSISVLGGDQSGDGGFVEVSGVGNLDFHGDVELSSPTGISGTLLLDPTNVVIATGGAATVAQVDQFGDTDTNTTSSSSTIAPSAIETALMSGSVEIQASDDITVNNDVVHTGTNNSLTLTAGDSINLDGGSITLSGSGSATLTLNYNASGTPGGATGGPSETVSWAGTETLTAHTVTITNGLGENTGGDLTLGNIVATDLNVDIGDGGENGSISQSAELLITGNATFDAGASSTSTNDITLSDSSNNFGTLVISAGGDVIVDDTDGINLGNVSAATLDVTAGGAIADTGATLSVTGAATFNAGANSVILGDATTANFGSLNITGSTVTVSEGGSTQINAVTASGSVNITSSGLLTVSGNVSTTGSSTVDLTGAGVTVDTGVDVTTASGQLTVNAGANTLTLSDSTGTDDRSTLTTTNAAISITADSIVIGETDTSDTDQVVAGGGNTITISNSSASRTIGLGGGAGDLSLNDAEIAELSTTGTISIGSGTAGVVTLDTADFSTAGGATTDLTLTTGANVVDAGGGGPHVTADVLTVSAVTGIGGAGTLIETSVATLSLTNSGTSGDIQIVDGSTAVSVSNAQLTNADGGSARDIKISTTGGSITVNGTVANAGTNAGSDVTIAAGGDTYDVAVNAAITTAAGDVNVTADDSVTFNASGSITATGAGNVVITADADADDNLTDTEVVTMASGAIVDADGGEIDIDADGDITLHRIISDSTGATAVDVNTSGGAILDATDDTDTVNPNITTGTGGEITLTASGLIGRASGTDTRLEVSAGSVLDASTGAANIRIAGAGALTLLDVDTTNGAIDITTDSGDLTATDVVAGGTNTVDLTTTTSGDVIVDDVQAVGSTITINSAGAIEENPDVDADLTASALDLTAANGIGDDGTTEEAIETVASTITFGNTTNDVLLTNTLAGGVTVDGSNGSGTVTIEETAGNLTVGASDITTSAGAVNLTASAADADIIAASGSDITTGAGGAITLVADNMDLLGAVNAGNQLITLRPQNAGTVIELAGATTDTTTLGLTITELNNLTTTNGITIGSGATTGGISVAGTVSVTGMTGGSTLTLSQGAGNITFSDAGSINLSGNPTNDVTLSTSSAVVGDTGNTTTDITSDVLTISAGTGVGTAAAPLETSVSSLSVTNSGATGDIQIVDGSTAVSVSNAQLTNADGGSARDINISTTGGSITVSGTVANAGTNAGSDVTIAAGGDTYDVAVNATITTAAGDVNVTADDSVTFNASGSITATGAGNVVITADADTDDTDGEVVTMASSATVDAGGGIIDIDATGDVTLHRITTSNTGTTAVDVNTAGQILDATDDVDLVNPNITTGSGGEITLTAGGLIGEAAGGTDSVGRLEVSANSVVDASTNAAEIRIAGAGALTLLDVDTTGGAIDITTDSGNLTATDVIAGGSNNVTLGTTTSGDVIVGSVSASGATAQINSAGTIDDATLSDTAGIDVEASTIDLNADTMIGGTTDRDLEVRGTMITADTVDPTTGVIDINSLANAGVTATLTTTTGAGNITFGQSGNQTLGITATSADGAIDISNTGGNVTATSVSAGGTNNVTLTTSTAGDVLVGSVTAADDTVQINSAGTIDDAALSDTAGIDVEASTIDLNADTMIGGTTNRDMEVRGTMITADTVDATTGVIDINSLANAGVTATLTTTTGAGNITFGQTGNQTLGVTATSADGAIDISNTGGNLTATSVIAGGTNTVDLTTTTSGDVIVDDVQAVGSTITINSAGAIEENPDVDADLTASALDLTAANGIGDDGTTEEAIETVASTITFGNTTNDVLLTNTLAGGVTVDGSNGSGTVTIEETAGNLTVGASDITTSAGAVNLTASAADADIIAASGSDITTGAGAAITLRSDDMDLQGAVNAGSAIVTLRSEADSRAIDLGTETGGELSLTNTELGNITAGTLRIGHSDGSGAGAIDITDALSPGSITNLTLISGGVVTDTGGTISVSGLEIQSAGATLDGANTVATLSAAMTGEGNSFTFTGETDGFTVGTVDTVSGVSTANTISNTASGDITLSAAAGAIAINDDVVTGLATVADTGGNETVESGTISITAVTGISTTSGDTLQTGAASLTTSDAGGTDAVDSGDITLNVTGSGDVTLVGADAVVIGAATGQATTTTVTAGSITVTSADRVNAGAGVAADVSIGAATGGSTNNQGSLSIATDGGAGAAGEIQITSGESLQLGTLDTDDGTAQTVNVTVTGADGEMMRTMTLWRM